MGLLIKAHEKIVAFGNAWSAYLVALGIPGAVIAAIIRWGQPFAGPEPWNWAEAVLIGLGAASILVLVTSVAAIAWRRLKPLPADAGDVASSLVDAGADQSVAEEVSEIVARLQEGISERAVELTSLQRRVDTLDAREQNFLEGEARRYQLLGEFKDRIESLEKSLADHVNLSEERRLALQTNVDGLSNAHFRTLQMARALAHVARMDEKAREIEGGVELLRLEPGGQAATTDWNTWGTAFDGWRSDLEGWVEWARDYVPDAHDTIFNLSTDDTGPHQNWLISDDEFPNSVCRHDYRKFLAIYSKWRLAAERAKAQTFRIIYS